MRTFFESMWRFEKTFFTAKLLTNYIYTECRLGVNYDHAFKSRRFFHYFWNLSIVSQPQFLFQISNYETLYIFFRCIVNNAITLQRDKAQETAKYLTYYYSNFLGTYWIQASRLSDVSPMWWPTCVKLHLCNKEVFHIERQTEKYIDRLIDD